MLCRRSASRTSPTSGSAGWSSSRRDGEDEIAALTEKLLANPLIEDFEIEVLEGA